jgi:hypothetical protein
MTILAGEWSTRTLSSTSHAWRLSALQEKCSVRIASTVQQKHIPHFTDNTSKCCCQTLLRRQVSGMVFHRWKVCKGPTHPDGDGSRRDVALGKPTSMAKPLTRVVHFLLLPANLSSETNSSLWLYLSLRYTIMVRDGEPTTRGTGCLSRRDRHSLLFCVQLSATDARISCRVDHGRCRVRL